ncbi:bifunctional diaminohydroxyphosphoribosylaminopyrimidine deaminase/5-amino-6-(5-phosphoribosylamino)uracil reductase RibD [Ulvibacterium sp.]|uniref:bifunctional diaminohydroxyphosphoribosylaminopyrimidine deaminase/5-amino-6-(5-phosphoribosylamino)uracil reductase RibD n=1 Tax=Ulvibacterium sp. TaxID=2665914 RepID=UPI003BABB8AF
MKIQQKDISQKTNAATHERYMRRCIQLAKNGLGTTAPNPMVGCVIVHQDKIIGEGFTSPYGGPHAEVNAIEAVRDKSLLREATLYVTLEPCSHFGKTPPCADLIIKHTIPKVVVGILDPHDKVSGRGVERLRNAGCEVVLGILEGACRQHHKRFLTFQEKARPYIILKWAQTLDGYIAPDKSVRNEDPEPYWITNTHSRQKVHQWRSEEQAILVGNQTVLEDNPRLDVRHWHGKSPLRVVLDKNLKIKKDFHILDGSIPTLILTTVTDSSRYVEGILYEVLDFSANLAEQICDVLHKHQILSVLVEGGAQTLQTFINSGLWDEARVFTGTRTFTNGIAAPKLSGSLLQTESIHTDTLHTYQND